MPLFWTALRALCAIAFVALCVTTALTLAPLGGITILAFRAGWIGTGLLILGSIVFNVWLLFWMIGLFHPQHAPLPILRKETP